MKLTNHLLVTLAASDPNVVGFFFEYPDSDTLVVHTTEGLSDSMLDGMIGTFNLKESRSCTMTLRGFCN